MTTLHAHAKRVYLIALLTACGGRGADSGEASAGHGATRAECNAGTWVDSEAGPVCLFRRDQALVIEGGFECPPSFAFRIDTATAIACSASEIDRLPPEVCAAIEGECEVTDGAGNGSQVDDTAHPVAERWGGPGECSGPMPPCVTAADCPTDDYACLPGGVCVSHSCNDDDECALSEPETRCRADRDGLRRCRDACTEKADCLDEGQPAEASEMDCVDGVCTHVGCTSDAQCTPEVICEDQPEGTCEPWVCVMEFEPELPYCASRCQTPGDCAVAAQRELGLDGPDPNDPWTQVDMFTCRQGFCGVKILGCSVDADCALIGSPGPCWLP